MANKRAYEITWLIRRVFRGMAAAADRYLEDSDLSAADRAVMEFLYPDRKLSVPEIARRYQVSRQHVQVTVNSLLQRGLLTSRSNPKHKRSRLIGLSELGRETFAEIRRNEASTIDDLFADITEEAKTVTHQTLQTLYEKLS